MNLWPIIQYGRHMKLRKGKWRYKTPPIGMIHIIQTRLDGGYWLTLRQEYPEAIEEMNLHAKLGAPAAFGFRPYDNELLIYPPPDKSREIFIKYYPPMQEM